MKKKQINKKIAWKGMNHNNKCSRFTEKRNRKQREHAGRELEKTHHGVLMEKHPAPKR